MPELSPDTLKSGAAEAALGHLDALPTLAPIALELLELACSPDSDVRQIATRLRADQSLASKVLAVANSAALAAREPITSLDQAIVRLGLRQLRNIVLAVKVFEAFPAAPAGGESRDFERVELWRHALAVACAARALASRSGGEVQPDQAFLAGLLHDLGKVALDSIFPKAYERAVRAAERRRGDLLDFEQAQLGLSHTLAGRRLAERWGLPAFLQEVIWLHHMAPEALPAGTAHGGLIGLVSLADALAREQRVGFSGNHAYPASAAEQAEQLGFSEADVAAVSESLVGEVAELSNLLGLDRETPAALYVKSLTRANGELSRLNTDLMASNQRLAVAARYFRALTYFDQQLSARSTIGDVTQAISEAARIVLETRSAAALVGQPRGGRLEIAVSAEDNRPVVRSEPFSEELEAWFGSSEPGALVQAAPPGFVRLASPGDGPPPGAWWILALACHDERVGAILLQSPEDPARSFRRESEELRLWLSSIGLAVGRTLAHAAAQRLSDDLAETNRRLQQVQAEVLRTRTLAMIAEMATGAGHELNNPLAVISGRAQLLLDAAEDAGERRSLELIHAKAHECSQIVTELMSFAQPPKPSPQNLSLAEFLAQVRSEWLAESGLSNDRCALTQPPAGPAAVLRADPQQLRQALIELLRNAALAIEPNQGRIAIGWRAYRESGTQPARSGAWIELAIRDTGVGMSPAAAQRAFTPFYSNRPAGRGRGLGLPRAYRLIEANGGRTWLESQPGAGTTAYVVLPVTQ